MKRDREFLRALLLEMQSSEQGFILHQLLLDPSPEESKLDHHLMLLMDEKLVAKTGEDGFRLTSLGHDSAEVLEKSALWSDLKDAAPREAYQILKGVGSSLTVAALSKLMGWS